MTYQANPFILAQIVPVFITFGLGIYFLSRPMKKRATNYFALAMFAAALWALSDAIRLISPDLNWQIFWNAILYIGVVIVPTAWFLLAVNFTGYGRSWVEKHRFYFWIVPAATIIIIFTNNFHGLFFTSYDLIERNGLISLVSQYGVLFQVHTVYSYVLLLLGFILMVYSLISNFKAYGILVFGLIIGLLAPWVANAVYIMGFIPSGFPDPTPLAFAVTGIAFALTIFLPLYSFDLSRNLEIGLVVLDFKRRILDINPASETIFNITEANPTGKTFEELVGEKNPLVEKINTCLDQAADEAVDSVFAINGSEKTYNLHISAVKDSNQNITGHIIQMLDISRLVRAEADLERTHKEYRAIVETLQDVYFEADTTGVLTYVNQSFIEAVGYQNKEEIIGKNFRHFTDRKVVRQVFERFNTLIETKQPLEPFYYRYRHKDKSVMVSEIVASPITDGDKVIGSRGIIRDITERVKAEQALRAARDEAETRAGELAAINHVAETVSHSLDIGDFLQPVCQELVSIFKIQSAGIALLDPANNNLEVVANFSKNGGSASPLGFLSPMDSNSAILDAVAMKNTTVLEGVAGDSWGDNTQEGIHTEQSRTAMIVPLLTRSQAIGIIRMPAEESGYIFTENEIELAETVASQIASAVDNANLHAQTETALDIAESDLEIGREIQSGFFPEQMPEIPGWEIATYFQAARQVSGDFYDVFPIGDTNYYAVVIADVCDKGVGAALFMVMLRSLIRSFSELYQHTSRIDELLHDITISVNNYIINSHGRSNMFATLVLGILDPAENKFYYVNGGHDPPLMMDASGNLKTQLEPTGPAFGFTKELDFDVEALDFLPGDLLLAYTDGITDARDIEGEFFSDERLMQGAGRSWTSAFSAVKYLEAEVFSHIGEHQQFDDVTLVAVRRNPKSQPVQHCYVQPAEMVNLPHLRKFVGEACQIMKVDKENTESLKIAIDEACSNLVIHGYTDRQIGEIKLCMMRSKDEILVQIEDTGHTFNPTAFSPPDLVTNLDQRQVGGLGVYFINQLMDEVYYESHAGENQLSMKLNI